MRAVLLTLVISFLVPVDAGGAEPPDYASRVPRKDFDVVIVGGSTAALSAAFASADRGARTALLEPTDWLGGQLTASGVPAIDECWHTVKDPSTGCEQLNAAAIARDPRNMTPSFRDMLLRIGNPGRGWVSRFCFEPTHLLAQELIPQSVQRSRHLTIFYQTVPKSAEFDRATRRVTALSTIQRVARVGVPWNGYDRFLSADLADWYSPNDSERFLKFPIRFEAGPATVFIDASEWGELLVLANAPYLQGVETTEGGRETNDQIGQCVTFGFVEQYLVDGEEEKLAETKDLGLGWGMYRNKPEPWKQIWTYRRIRAIRAEPSPGDFSLQNWGYDINHREGGNDYPFGYLFLPQDAVHAQRGDWEGGIRKETLIAAEKRALAWHAWFKRHSPSGIDPRQIALARGPLGTGHGLSKLPYVRDTRRSIGLDGFVLRIADLTGDPGNSTAPAPVDRVAIGCYDADIHPLENCEYPAYIREPRGVLPFYIPFRALTNEAYDNLIVAGKTMAQTFLANSATRVHPIEWSTGVAAGTAAAEMAKTGASSRDILVSIDHLQTLIVPQTPIDWTLDAHGAPSSGK